MTHEGECCGRRLELTKWRKRSKVEKDKAQQRALFQLMAAGCHCSTSQTVHNQVDSLEPMKAQLPLLLGELLLLCTTDKEKDSWWTSCQFSYDLCSETKREISVSESCRTSRHIIQSLSNWQEWCGNPSLTSGWERPRLEGKSKPKEQANKVPTIVGPRSRTNCHASPTEHALNHDAGSNIDESRQACSRQHETNLEKAELWIDWLTLTLWASHDDVTQKDCHHPIRFLEHAGEITLRAEHERKGGGGEQFGTKTDVAEQDTDGIALVQFLLWWCRWLASLESNEMHIQNQCRTHLIEALLAMQEDCTHDWSWFCWEGKFLKCINCGMTLDSDSWKMNSWWTSSCMMLHCLQIVSRLIISRPKPLHTTKNAIRFISCLV